MNEFINEGNSIVNTNSLASFFTETDAGLYNKFTKGDLVVYVNDKNNKIEYEMFYYKDKIFKGLIIKDHTVKGASYNKGELIDDSLFALSSFMVRSDYRYLDIKVENIIDQIIIRFKHQNACYETLNFSYYYYDDEHIYRTPRYEFEYSKWTKNIRKYGKCYLTQMVNLETLISDIWETHFVEYKNYNILIKSFDWSTLCNKHFTVLKRKEKKSIDKFHKKNKLGKIDRLDNKTKVRTIRRMIQSLEI